MILDREYILEVEKRERFHLLVYLDAADYMEGIRTLADRVAERDKQREAATNA